MHPRFFIFHFTIYDFFHPLYDRYRVISQYHLLQRLVLRIGDAYEVHICILEASSIAFASFVCLTLFSQLLEI